MTSVKRRVCPHSPVSTFPLTATTGASVFKVSKIPGPPTSPAWRIRSEPRRARTASSRNNPCVSEINPTIFLSLGNFLHRERSPKHLYLTSRSNTARLVQLPQSRHVNQICHASPIVSRHFHSTFTISSAFTRACSTCKPQWRCGPVTRPVAPTLPRTVPASTSSPTFASISEKWQ
jgi:hypothetical protein